MSQNINVQKASGTNALTGNLVVGDDVTLTTSGTGTIAATSAPAAGITGTLAVAHGGTGVTTSTGSGSVVLSSSPTLTTPNLGTPTAATLTNATGLPLTTGVTGTLPVGNGGTGATTLTGYVKGSGTSAFTASATVPGSDVSGNITGNAAGLTNTLVIGSGGTGVTTTPTNGQILIGNGTGYTVANISAGVGVSIANGSGSIQISADGGVNYQGTWNASTNTPTLTSSVGTKGFYYVVNVAGSTNLNGITDWKVGDWALFNGSVWEKVDNTDQVTSVFGRQGAVAAVSTDYSAVGITNTAIGATNPSTGNFTSVSTTTGAVTVGGTGTYGALQLPAGSTSIYGVAFGTDTNLWRTDAGNVEMGGASVALIGLNVGGTNKGYFYNNGTDTTLAGAGTLTLKSNGTTTGLTLDSSNATVAGTITVSGTTDSSSKDTGAIVTEGGLGVEKSATIGGNLTVSGASSLFGSGTASSYSNYTNLTLGGGSAGTNLDFKTSADARRAFIVWDSANNQYLLGTTGAANPVKLQVQDQTKLTVSNTAVTVADNLTVSGTGTSTFAGRIQTTSANGIEAIVGSGNTGFAIQSGTTQYSLYLNAADNSFRIYSSLGGDRLTVSSGGNFLIGTTIDGGQLLQVNGTAYVNGNATFAGGIWSTAYTNIPNDSTSRAILGVSGGVAYLQSLTGQTNNALSIDGSSITFRSGSYATALTLDGSQNAEFKGSVLTVPNGSYFSWGNGNVTLLGNSAANTLALSTNGVPALSFDGSQNATFASGVRIGNDKVLGFSKSDGTTNYWQLYNSTSNVFTLVLSGIGTALSFDTSTNATFAGNIIGSKDIQLGNTYTLTWGGAYGAGIPTISGSTGAGHVQIYPTGSTSGATATFTASTTTLTGNLTVSGTGNSSVAGTLLVATTTNSSNGALQLATHTTSAGGIGFGTDTSLYRPSTGRLTVGRNDGTNAAYLRFAYNTSTSAVETGSIGAQNGTLYIDALDTNGQMVLRTNGTTTALTLDSSQNATFAGSIAINNTVQTAVSVASTHKVTISIGGVTYYLLATNV